MQPSSTHIINQMLMSAYETAKTTGAWLHGQLPDILHQFIIYMILRQCSGILCGISFIFVIWFIARKFYKGVCLDWMDKLLVKGTATMITVVILVFILSDLTTIIQIWLAPKFFLLHYLAHLATWGN